MPKGIFNSIAFDLSADGTVIVGFGTTAQGQEAFIWSVAQGMRKVKDVLILMGVNGLERWQFTEATGVSANGRTLVGNGINPSGQAEGLIARLP